MSLLVRPHPGQRIVSVTPESAHWKHVGFAAYRLAAGEAIDVREEGRELCIVVLAGTVTVTAGSQVWENVGRRASVFEDAAPYAVYLPPALGARIHAAGDAELGIASAPARGQYPARLIEPSRMARSTRGRGTNTRYVCDILPETQPAEELLIVEVRTPGGHASSYPPHKHDTDNIPAESALEEIYYHRFNPPQGFAFQRVYTDRRDLDETMSVEDHGVVMVPRGYHPVVVPHGYDNYYLNVMAGEKRSWRIKNDPAHEWIIAKDADA